MNIDLTIEETALIIDTLEFEQDQLIEYFPESTNIKTIEEILRKLTT